jgi:Uma2 family endonuclease
MSGLTSDIAPDFVTLRKRTGIDKFDEMWEGVLHMAPAPSRSHQDFHFGLLTWLRSHWALPCGNRVHGEVNVASPGGWPENFRIPDLVLLTPNCFDIDRDVYFEGPPTVVVEIRSPGDETMEKLSFYAELGVPEVWVLDRDTKGPELYVLRSGRYERQSPTAEGWLCSGATGVRLRGEPDNRLALQLSDNQTTYRLLPEA